MILECIYIDTSSIFSCIFMCVIADPSERSYPLVSKTVNILNGQSLDESAIIDNSLGRDSQFIFDYSENQGTIIYGEINWILHCVVSCVV